MKALPVIPAALTLVAMIIVAAVRPAHGHEMMLAAAITGVVTFGCVSLLVAMAKKEIITVVQTALVSTVGQMMLTGGAAIVLGLSGVSGEFRAFAIWVIVFYWIELAVLAFCAVRVIRKASPGPATSKGSDPMVKCL